MFSRRHPMLFFFLMSFSIFMGGLLLITVVTSILLSNTFHSSTATPTSEVVGIIKIQDAIIDSADVLDQLQTLSDERLVKSILIRVDSPGGTVGASQEIYAEILRVKKRKPVIVSMGNLCASGGYYLSAAATGIVANPGTLTGSIGVILNTANIEELLKKIGVGTQVIKSGEYKDVASFSRSMTNAEKELLQDMINQTNEQFIKAIARGRKLPIEKVRTIADGRPILGETALRYKLIDRLGNYTDALLWAGELGGIDGRPETYSVAPQPSFWEEIWKSSLSNALNRTFGQFSPGLAYLYAPGR